MKPQFGKVLGRELKFNRDYSGPNNFDPTRVKKVIVMQCEITDPDDVQSIEVLTQTGEDNNPPINARVAILDLGNAFKIAIGTDDIVEPITDPGEKRLYSTDEDNTTYKAAIYIKNDGSIEIDHVQGLGYGRFKTSGEWEFNGARITTSGDFITANGKSLDNHTHSQPPDSAGNTQAETNAPS